MLGKVTLAGVTWRTLESVGGCRHHCAAIARTPHPAQLLLARVQRQGGLDTNIVFTVRYLVIVLI